MKSVSESLLLRNTLLQNYEKALATNNDEERKSLLNVVIVGGGPTGVELAGAIAEMRNKILPKDYAELNFQRMHIYLIEAASRLMGTMSPDSSQHVEYYLRTMNVEVLTNTSVQDYNGTNVLLSNGEVLKSNCLIWAAGVKGLPLAGISPFVSSASGRFFVDEYNRIKEMKNIFSIGDVALMQTKDFPKGHAQIAPVAIQQASMLAINLKNTVLGKPLTALHFKDKGSMATVGKNKAVAEIGKLRLSGFIAWFIWMAVHMMSIIGVKNRLVVLLNWMWQYFTYDQSLRLIIKPSDRKTFKTTLHAAAIVLLAAGFLAGCQPRNDNKDGTSENIHNQANVDSEKESSSGLTLNNGAKWKADSITNFNVSALTKISAAQKPSSLEEYHTTGKLIQDALNKLLQDCRMKGPDHEALHHWIEPLLETNNHLVDSKNTGEAVDIFLREQKQINIYPQYFE